jgi:hypothetical protein
MLNLSSGRLGNNSKSVVMQAPAGCRHVKDASAHAAAARASSGFRDIAGPGLTGTGMSARPQTASSAQGHRSKLVLPAQQPSRRSLTSFSAAVAETPSMSSSTGVTVVTSGSDTASNSSSQQRSQANGNPASTSTSSGSTMRSGEGAAPLLFLNGQRVHSLHARGMDVIKSLDSWADTDLVRGG